MNLVKYLLAMTLLLIAACGSNNSGGTGSNIISLKGGAGGTAQGGSGGTITSMTFSNTTSMVHGDLKFHTTGTVDTNFTVQTISPALGTNPAVISADTSVGSVPSVTPGAYYVQAGDNNLYLVGPAGTAAPVTGLTVNAGKKLTIPNINVFTLISGGIVINGSVSSTTDGGALDLRSGSFIQINAGGTVATTPITTGTDSGLLSLTSGGVMINGGTIASNGRTGSGGNSVGVTLTAGTFLYNIGTVSAKGDGAGTGGPIQLLARAGSIFNSGIIDSSGGSGATGGNAGPISITGGESATVVGRVMLGGTVTGTGGNGSAGSGGNGAAMTLTSRSGGILVTATVSANGGTGSAGGNGGNGGSLQMHNMTGADKGALNPVSPEGIKVGSSINMNGGTGGGQGGAGGIITVASDVEDTSLNGFSNVEFFGYQSFTLDGGASTNGGSGGNGGNVTCGLTGPLVLSVQFPSGALNNDVPISCKGGDNNLNSATKTNPGGIGGTVSFLNPQKFNFGDPIRTVVNNTGAIDVSGGAGTTGGSGGAITMKSYGNLAVTGTLTGNGGTGTTGGAQGATITLFSSFNASNSGGTFINGGDGINGAAGGRGGAVSISSGNQTSTTTISANGGSSRAGALPATNGGDGGTIDLSSEFALTSRGALSVLRGSGGGANSAVNGTIKIDGSFSLG